MSGHHPWSEIRREIHQGAEATANLACDSCGEVRPRTDFLAVTSRAGRLFYICRPALGTICFRSRVLSVNEHTICRVI